MTALEMQVLGLMRQYRAQKQAAAQLRGEMVKAAVAIGMPQEDALKESLSSFLSGYLLGAGHKPAYWRAEDGQQEEAA